MVKAGRNSSTMTDDAGWKNQRETKKTSFANRKGDGGFRLVSVHGEMTFVTNIEDERKYTNEVNTPIAEYIITVSLGMAGMNIHATKSAFLHVWYVKFNNIYFDCNFKKPDRFNKCGIKTALLFVTIEAK